MRNVPTGPIQKGNPGIYWNSKSGPYYAYDGKSDYATPMWNPAEKIPISYLKKVHKLNSREVRRYIESCKNGIGSLRCQIRWMEKYLSSLYQ